MTLPFSSEQFLDVFKNYNEAVYPMQIVFYVLAAIAVISAIRPFHRYNIIIPVILSLFWIWMGLFYHILFFAAINKAAFLFGGVFILQGILILHYGYFRKKLIFQFKPDMYGITGWFFILFALLVYPYLSYVNGHVYPYSPTFGLPCPTTIFTFGFFLWSATNLPKWLLVIPVIWSIVGFSAAITLGMTEDFGLIVAGLVTTGFIFLKANPKKHAAIES